MNYTKRTKAALMMAVMTMLSSTCYAGVDTSDVAAQQPQGNQAAFRWEAVNQEAKKIAVEQPPTEVTQEKAIPIIITAADVDAMNKKHSRMQGREVNSATGSTGIQDANGNFAGGGSANVNENPGSNGLASPGGAGTALGTNGLAGNDAAVNGSGLSSYSGSGSEASWGSGSYSAGAKGQRPIDDSDTDLRIYPLNGKGAAHSSSGVTGQNVVALPEPEPVAATAKPPAGKTVSLPPIQPVPGEARAVTVLSSGKVVELPPIEKVAQISGERAEKIVELPPIHSVK
ncbi:hypothetical protein [Selenomonas sp. WCT3]|uniref:hypothetical protein n=1 Tax=Selenomonas sp. WCT3 TaxID=3158785 RepID=UPI00117A7F09